MDNDKNEKSTYWFTQEKLNPDYYSIYLFIFLLLWNSKMSLNYLYITSNRLKDLWWRACWHCGKNGHVGGLLLCWRLLVLLDLNFFFLFYILVAHFTKYLLFLPHGDFWCFLRAACRSASQLLRAINLQTVAAYSTIVVFCLRGHSHIAARFLSQPAPSLFSHHGAHIYVKPAGWGCQCAVTENKAHATQTILIVADMKSCCFVFWVTAHRPPSRRCFWTLSGLWTCKQDIKSWRPENVSAEKVLRPESLRKVHILSLVFFSIRLFYLVLEMIKYTKPRWGFES